VIRRRIALGLVAVVLLSVGMGAWLVARERARGACEQHQQQLVGIWDEGVRESIHAAFVATGQPYAESAWSSASTRLDAYAGDWLARRQRTCEAALAGRDDPPGTLEQVALCLDGRLRGLSALTSLLAGADAAVVEHAVQAVLGLEPLAGCDEPRAGVDPAAGEQLVATDARLRRASVLHDAGRYVEGIEVATAALEAAQEISHLPSQGRAWILLGRLHLQQADREQAEESLLSALTVAERAGEDLLAIRAQVELVRVVGFEGSRPEEAERIARQARARLEHAGADDGLRGRLGYHVGLALYGAGRYAEALDALDAALEQTVRAVGESHPAVAAVLTARGVTHYEHGRGDAAVPDYERSLAIWTETVGPEHPQTAVLINNLGIIALDAGRHEEALRRYDEALRIWRATVGPEDKRVAMALNNKGSVYAALGQHDASLEHQRQALAIQERRLGADHTDVARSLNNIGNALNGLGRHEEAIAALERALGIYDTVLGPEHPYATYPRGGLAWARLGLGEASKAREAFERVLEIRRRALGQEHRDLIDALQGAGEAALAVGDHKGAAARLEEALALHERHGSTAVEAARTRFALARALVRRDSSRARVLATQARDAYAGTERSSDLAEVDA
jgi:serine/threonine-protein kinase